MSLIPSNNQLKYSVVGYSTQIGQDEFNDIPGEHSPIIGWAYDGNPIYGPRGYSNPFDNSSSIKILETGYKIHSNIKDREKLDFELGFFVDDYTYSPTTSTDLDEHNGRYCRTPDYPNGVYAYFASINSASQKPVFPYFIGNTYRSVPSVVDSRSTITQSFDFNNSKLTRNTFPYKLSDSSANNDFIVESNENITTNNKSNISFSGFCRQSSNIRIWKKL